MMKKVLLFSVTCMMICAASSALAGGAPSLVATMLDWTGERYDVIEGQFKCVDLAPCTYYAMHCWSDDNGNGTGYAGFQFKDGQTWTILSIWDTAYGSAAIEYAPDSAVAERFGGEGEGMHVLVPYEWETGVWYTMRIQACTEGSRTVYEQWVRPETGKWTKLAAISYSKPNLGFTWNCFFIEDWTGNGLQRSCQLRRYYARKKSDGKWQSLSNYYITCEEELATAYSFCRTDAATVYIQSGGNIIGVEEAPGTLTVLQSAIPDWSPLLGP